MRSKTVRTVMRLLIALLGAGIGAALTLGVVEVIHLTSPETVIPLSALVLGYVGTALVFGVVFFMLSTRLMQSMTDTGSRIEQYMDEMPVGQMVCGVAGLLTGLVIAALLSNIVRFMGNSIATVSISAILYLSLGVLGYSIGRRRSDDLVRFSLHLFSFRGRTVQRKRVYRKAARAVSREKVLDSSALIDGRVADVAGAGFIEGTLVAPDFMVDELRKLADSADPTRRAKGRRGLDMLEKLKEMKGVVLRTDATEWEDTDDVDVKLLRLAKKLNAAVITGDYNLGKAAAVSGVRVMSIDRLAGALRPVLAAGDTLCVTVVKEGREPGQGVGYLEDGTMVVVDGGRALVGQTVDTVVTSALQTSAGRMIFVRPDRAGAG